MSSAGVDAHIVIFIVIIIVIVHNDSLNMSAFVFQYIYLKHEGMNNDRIFILG